MKLTTIRSWLVSLLIPILAAVIVGAVAWFFAFDPLARATDLTAQRVRPVSSTAAGIQRELKLAFPKGAMAKEIDEGLPPQSSGGGDAGERQTGASGAAQAVLEDAPVAAAASCLALAPDSPCRDAPKQDEELARRTVVFWIDAADRSVLAQHASAAKITPQQLIDSTAAALQKRLEKLQPQQLRTSHRVRLQELDPSNAARLQRLLAARWSWLSAAFLFVVLAMTGAIVSGAVVVDVTSDWKMPTLWPCLLLMTSILIVAVSVTFPGDRMLVPAGYEQLLLDALQGDAGKRIRGLLSLFNGIGAASAFTLLGGMAACAAATPKKAPHQRLQTLLIVAAAFMAAGVLEVGALYRLPVSYVESPEAATHVEELSQSLTSAAGLFLSVLLLTTYMAAAFVLEQRRIAADVGTEGPFARLTTLLTVFAPAWLGLSLDSVLRIFTTSGN